MEWQAAEFEEQEEDSEEEEEDGEGEERKDPPSTLPPCSLCKNGHHDDGTWKRICMEKLLVERQIGEVKSEGKPHSFLDATIDPLYIHTSVPAPQGQQSQQPQQVQSEEDVQKRVKEVLEPCVSGELEVNPVEGWMEKLEMHRATKTAKGLGGRGLGGKGLVGYSNSEHLIETHRQLCETLREEERGFAGATYVCIDGSREGCDFAMRLIVGVTSGGSIMGMCLKQQTGW